MKIEAWPPRMNEITAAIYCGEKSPKAFLKQVGKLYPPPVIDRGRGRGRVRIWNKSDLDRVIKPTEAVVDAADLL